MNKQVKQGVDKKRDSIQQRLTHYACDLNYDALPPEAIHAAKVRLIDTLASLIGGFFGPPCHITRNLAAAMSDAGGATVIGTRIKTTPDMAAYANATTARYVEMNDTYHWPGAIGGHPSDVMTPLLAAAEYARSSGRELITALVLAYEVFLRISDVFPHEDFCQTNFCCLATATATGKLWQLDPVRLAHCISMAAVPNNILNQVRKGHLSMWKAVASGHASRAGVFAAMLARAGMEGPHLPFEGKAGWCDHVARNRFALDTMGGNGTPFKILDSLIKRRSSCGTTISSILAAEKVAPMRNVGDIGGVTVEVYQAAKDMVGTGEHHWNPDSRETADHSIPYVVAATLIDGTINTRSFDDVRLWNPELRALMQKIEVVTNTDFTKAYARIPCEHKTRITVVTNGGERLVGETGGGDNDLAAAMSNAQIDQKFRALTDDLLSTKQANLILDRLWNLEDMENVADIPPAFVIA